MPYNKHILKFVYFKICQDFCTILQVILLQLHRVMDQIPWLILAQQ